MRRTAYAPSLLDDLSFVAELERLDSDLPPLRDMWGGVRGGRNPRYLKPMISPGPWTTATTSITVEQQPWETTTSLTLAHWRPDA